MGLFDSNNRYLLASSYGLGYMSSFSDPLFNVSLFFIVRRTEITIHTCSFLVTIYIKSSKKGILITLHSESY